MGSPPRYIIWSCWLGSEKEHDKCANLVAGCSQTVWEGGGRPAEEWGGGIGELGGHVLLLSHVALGTVVGERQAGEENTTHRELWAWGLGEQDGCFFPRLYQREKIKCREIDLPLTIRLVAHTHTHSLCATACV